MTDSNRNGRRVLWRISNFADLSGYGGMVAGGRWHSKGRPVVYTADSASGALLETLVHLEVDPEDMPSSYQLLRIYLSADVSEQDCGDLPEDWRANQGLTRQIGDTWLREGDSLLLRVPSALAPDTSNYLFNPQHEEARDAEFEVSVHHIDSRLLPR